MLRVRTVVSMPFAENTYVVAQPGQTAALVIDPGLEPDAILELLAAERWHVAAILNTHGHADHIAGNAAIKAAFPAAPLMIGRGDAPLLVDAEANLSAAFGMPITSPPADGLLDHGATLDLAGIQIHVRALPGHSPGHVVLVVPGTPTQVFAGDTLFQGSIGRTDFPGGSLPLLLAGIERELLSLPDDTRIYPGHGDATTIAAERRSNPYLRQA